MTDELEPIGPEDQIQLDEAQEAAESSILPGVRELPWIVLRSQLEALDEEDIRAVVIDQNEKIGRIYGALSHIAKDYPDIIMILNPPSEQDPPASGIN